MDADLQMKFNEARCHSMRVTWRHKHHNQFHFDYSLHNPTFENVQSIKYLGITSLTTQKSKWVLGQETEEVPQSQTNPKRCEERHIKYFHVPLQDGKKIKVKQPFLSSSVKN